MVLSSPNQSMLPCSNGCSAIELPCSPASGQPSRCWMARRAFHRRPNPDVIRPASQGIGVAVGELVGVDVGAGGCALVADAPGVAAGVAVCVLSRMTCTKLVLVAGEVAGEGTATFVGLPGAAVGEAVGEISGVLARAMPPGVDDDWAVAVGVPRPPPPP